MVTRTLLHTYICILSLLVGVFYNDYIENEEINSTPSTTSTPNIIFNHNSRPESFTYSKESPNPPNCTMLVNPVNGDDNVAINTGIEWNPSPGALGYSLTVINLDTGFPITDNGMPILDLNVGNITLFNFDENLPVNSEISVQITPFFDEQDTNSETCIIESFTTRNFIIPTQCSSLQSPSITDDVPSHSPIPLL